MSALRTVKLAKCNDILAAREAVRQMAPEADTYIQLGQHKRTGYGRGENCDMLLCREFFQGRADVGWQKETSGEYTMLWDADDTRKLNQQFGGNFEMSFNQYYTCAVAAKELTSKGYSCIWDKLPTGEVRIQATAW